MSGLAACGQLESADNGQLKIVEDEDAATVVPATKLGGLRIVKEC